MAIFLIVAKADRLALSFGVVGKIDIECATIPSSIINEEKKVRTVYSSVLLLTLALNRICLRFVQ